jgi:hypothetical protein
MKNNKTCKPRKPKDMDSKALQCLNVLLNGGRINRKTLGEMGIAAHNSSAHSYISILRNQWFIPIVSERQEDGTSDYFMVPEEIMRYKNPTLRSQQMEETRADVLKKRHKEKAKSIQIFLRVLRRDSQIWRHVPGLRKQLSKIAKEINALLEKSADKSNL